MAKEWVEKLASDIKEKDHHAAEEFKRQEHLNRVMATKGKEFFEGVIAQLREDITELTQALEGDVTASATKIQVQHGNPSAYNITRERFPQVTGNVATDGKSIVFTDQARRKSTKLEFHVGANDGLSVRGMFGQDARHFNHPSELAKYIMEELFSV